ncbi:MAG: V-type ATP synthase subunit E [Ruminococcus sp.]
MNGGDKILDRIKSDCDENIKAINEKAEETCRQILEDGKAQAEQTALEIAKKAEVKAAQISASSKSGAELSLRNALLKRRRKEIDITMSKLLEYLLSLDDNQYFEIIYKLASKLCGKSGELMLNSKDMSRLPKDFESKLSQIGLNAKVSEACADIAGGFILKCGDIEENMDFTAIINEKSEELEDLINRELFVQ